ncbi:hypothetical protein QP794_27040 [Paenibacillus sp. UMB7766-LJ446]|uniref:hypothetical protein n=1 Tax=Paenibacillus sp. UMB7766-LJ446 TaxID=3046313 RepID=UPI00254DDD9F|nr:hypothetical protein [Paenibacillus sp. UMB7766-LJ446]MDK8193744.1 hypothetical protein [Paenibacillus sp. UMB7766-LJ446]
MEIPQHLYQDKYWRSTLYLFMNQPSLRRCLTTKYFDLEGGIIESAALKRLSKPWSLAEKFMLNLALHLFNANLAKVNLADMDYLDSNNLALVHEALKIRFG